MYFSNERPTVIILLRDLDRKHPDEVTMTVGSSPWGLKADTAALEVEDRYQDLQLKDTPGAFDMLLHFRQYAAGPV